MNAHAVVNLVALSEPSQDANGVFDGRLADVYLLEPTLESWIFFDVFAVLVEGGGADEMKFASGEHWLNHVAGVHCAFRSAGADDGVEFVDEGDNFAGSISDLFENGFEAFFKFTSVFCAGEHRGDIE